MWSAIRSIFWPVTFTRCPHPSENDHHRFTVHFTHGQSPGPAVVIEEIRRVRKLPGEPIGNTQPGVGANQFAFSAPVASLKSIHEQPITPQHALELRLCLGESAQPEKRVAARKTPPLGYKEKPLLVRHAPPVSDVDVHLGHGQISRWCCVAAPRDRSGCCVCRRKSLCSFCSADD